MNVKAIPLILQNKLPNRIDFPFFMFFFSLMKQKLNRLKNLNDVLTDEDLENDYKEYLKLEQQLIASLSV